MNKLNKFKSRVLLFVMLTAFICLVCGCIYDGTTSGGGNNVTNNVTNEITQTVVDYNSNVTIEDLEDAVTVTTKMVESSVIGVTLKEITTSTMAGKKYTFEDIEGIGSGVVYKRIENTNTNGELTSYTYYVITNAHVILSDDDAEHVVYAYLGNYNTEIKANILGYDEKIDLAVITFESYYLINPVEFQDVSKLEKGQFVVAVGNPDGYDYYGSVTFGIISNLGRYISFDTDGDGTHDYMGEYIQTDAAINPGNSGGGLFTLDGKLIGINSIKLASETIDNMGFAIPINIVKVAVEEYLEKGLEIIRPRLGVMIIAVRDFNSEAMIQQGITSFPNIYGDEKPYGIYISEFTSSGSLVNQGLHEGDIILTFDGDKLYESSQISGFLNSLDEYRVGTVVEITYYCCKTKTVEKMQITLKTGE